MVITAGIIGALLVAIPLLLAVFTLTLRQRALKAELAVYEEKQSSQKEIEIYQLKTKKLAGDEITDEDLVARTICVDADTKIAKASKNTIVGARCKIRLEEGTILQEAYLYNGEAITDDMRYLSLEKICLPENVQTAETVDIRIFFPTGEDYVVASGKKIQRLQTASETDDGVETSNDGQILVTEEELLYLASAYVDQEQVSGAKLYAIAYAGEGQEISAVNYPVNTEVFQLMKWDPNLVRKALQEKNEERRKVLEDHLKEAGVNGETNSETGSQKADIDRAKLDQLFE